MYFVDLVSIMSTEKITHKLRNFLQEQPANHVEVVIELNPVAKAFSNSNLLRSEKIALVKQDFMKEFEPVEKLILEQGGDILGAVWLNQTIKAKLPANSLEQIAQLKEIKAIDLPQPLTND